MRPYRKRVSAVSAFGLIALTLATVGALSTTAGASAAKVSTQKAKPGTLEICKSSANGVTGSFQFTVDGGAPITVAAGGCSGPLSVTGGTHKILELASSGYQTAGISVAPAADLVGKNVSAGSSTVRVTAGSTAANETVVTYTNEPSTGLTGQLKICKVAGDSSLAGDLFSFQENGGPAFSVAAGYPSANCSSLTTYQVGTVVNIDELATAGLYVSNITVSDGRGSNFNDSAGTVTATVGGGVTIVTYTNSIIPPAQTGYIEVCKSAGDQYVNGYFHFSITAPGYSSSQSVLTNQCSAPIQVPAGDVTVTEAAAYPFVPESIDVYQGSVVTENLSNGSIEVVVPVSQTSNNEVLVDYTNETQLGALKVCKTLAANSGALTGQTFSFDVTASFEGSPIYESPVSVVASTPGTTACASPIVLPLTSKVSVSEVGTPNVENIAVAVSPPSSDLGSTPPTANLTIGSGISTATFTNEATGSLKVCKVAADSETAGKYFSFSVNGGPTFQVEAGYCSQVFTVPAGSTTISESPSANFHLVSVTASPSSALVSVAGSTATVAVPYGGSNNQGNLVQTTFTNAVNTSTFELCETTSDPNITLPFTIYWGYDLNGTVHSGSVTEYPGQCSTDIATIPVVDNNGDPITVDTYQAPGPAPIVIDSITAGGAATLTSSNTSTGDASFTLGAGDNTLTYDTTIQF